jgi:hypothetical protein
MFLHKANKPAWLFINRILALLRDMGPAASATIDEGTCQDLRWFIACAHVANGTISIYKCLQPQTDIFVASLFTLLNNTPIWCPVPVGALEFDCTIDAIPASCSAAPPDCLPPIHQGGKLFGHHGFGPLLPSFFSPFSSHLSPYLALIS